MRRIIFLVLYFRCLCSITLENSKVILEDGVIRGTIYKTVTGREIYAFFGVPYATPPVGPDRFEASRFSIPLYDSCFLYQDLKFSKFSGPQTGETMDRGVECHLAIFHLLAVCAL